MKVKNAIWAMLALQTAILIVTAPAARAAVPSPRQVEWQRREVEAFVHFGINTFVGREFSSGSEDPKLFNPMDLDCDQWVHAAKSAGAKTVLLTVKHYDGFCLWPTEFSDYSVKQSAWRDGKGDVVRELADACKRGGVGFGIAIAPADRNHRDYARNSAAYNEYFKNLLRELMTKYDPISQVFIDPGQITGRAQAYDWQGYYRVIRELQPNALISCQGPDARPLLRPSGRPHESDWSVVPLPQAAEQFNWRPLRGKDLGSRERLSTASEVVWLPAFAEVMLTHDRFWDRHSDGTVKSVGDLMRKYEETVGRNVVLQLTLSPNTRGRIPETQLETLQRFGAEVQRLFGTNLITEAKSRVNKRDNVEGWITVATVDLDKASDVKYVVLQEDIRKGQMVEDFEVILTTFDDQRKTIPGTTIGYKRILKVNTPGVVQIEARVKQSRGKPDITVSAY